MLLAFALVAARGATGAPPGPPPFVLTLELDVPQDLQPDQLCVVSAGAYPGWNAPYLKDGALGPPGASLPLANLLGLRRHETSGPVAAAAPGPQATATKAQDDVWAFDAAGRKLMDLPGNPVRDRPAIAAALRALAPDDDTGLACSNGIYRSGADHVADNLCAPRFEVPLAIENRVGGPDKLHIACVPNLRPTRHDDPSVAVLFLNTHTGRIPAIKALWVDGTVASVQFEGQVDDNDVFIASVLGGHYAPSATASSAARRIVLPLTPRCETRHIELPYYDARYDPDLRVTFTEEGASLGSCESHVVGGYAQANIPVRPLVKARTLQLQGKTTGLRFATTWTERSAPADLHPTLQGIDISWKRHCLYPGDEPCPSAKLLDSGYECPLKPSADTTCHYTCDGGERTVPIRLPETVRFTREATLQTWTDRATYSGQELEGYLPKSDRSVLVRFPGLLEDNQGFLGILFHSNNPEHEADANWASSVDLSFAGGQHASVPFEPGGRVNLPFPTSLCPTTYTAEYEGAARYYSTTLPVQDGVIPLDWPQEHYSSPWAEVYVGVGNETKPIWAHDPYPLQQPPTGAIVTLGGAIDWSAWDSSWFYEALFEETMGRRDFYTQDSAGNLTPQGGFVVRTMLGFGLGAWLPHFHVVQAVLALSGGLTVFGVNGDSNPGDAVFGGVLQPSLRIRYPRITEHFGASLLVRTFFFEQTLVMDANNHVLQSAERDRASLELAVEYSF